MPTRTLLMDNWEFCLKDAPAPGDYAPVRLPHSWNVLDGQDGGGDYYRGKGWYRRVFSFEPAADKRYFVEFLGVNSVADVYLNGTHLGQHRGGYTCFRFELTGALVRGENTLLVCADNSPFPDVIPLEADFTFFGGIYREVYFLETGPTFFSLSDFGSDGVRLSYPNTPEVTSAAALCVEARVETAEETGVQLHVRVLSPAPFAPAPALRTRTLRRRRKLRKPSPRRFSPCGTAGRPALCAFRPCTCGTAGATPTATASSARSKKMAARSTRR